MNEFLPSIRTLIQSFLVEKGISTFFFVLWIVEINNDSFLEMTPFIYKK